MAKVHLDRLFALATLNPKRIMRYVPPGRHHAARTARAKARIAKRKAQR